MSEPTGKLKFAYNTISNLESKLDQVTKELEVRNNSQIEMATLISEQRAELERYEALMEDANERANEFGCKLLLANTELVKLKASSISKDAIELISEAADLFEDIKDGDYEVDSFTSQPYRAFLNKLAKPTNTGEDK